MIGPVNFVVGRGRLSFLVSIKVCAACASAASGACISRRASRTVRQGERPNSSERVDRLRSRADQRAVTRSRTITYTGQHDQVSTNRTRLSTTCLKLRRHHRAAPAAATAQQTPAPEAAPPPPRARHAGDLRWTSRTQPSASAPPAQTATVDKPNAPVAPKHTSPRARPTRAPIFRSEPAARRRKAKA